MLKSNKVFTEMKLADKIAYLTKNINESSLFLDKSNIDNATREEINALYSLCEIDQQSLKIAKEFKSNIASSKNDLISAMEQELINETQATQSMIKNILDETIVAAVDDVCYELTGTIKSKKNLIFGGILPSMALRILSSILEFKKKIDKALFKGASDKIIQATIGGMIALVGSQFPVIGLALKTSDIAIKLSRFFSSENLTKTVDLLNNTLTEFKNTKDLELIYKISSKTHQLAAALGISDKAASKFGTDLNSLNAMIEEVSKNPVINDIVKTIALKIDKTIPNSNNSAEVFVPIKKTLHSILDKNKDNVSQEVISSIHRKIDESINDIVNFIIHASPTKSSNLLENSILQNEISKKITDINKILKEDCNKIPENKNMQKEIKSAIKEFCDAKFDPLPMDIVKQIKHSPISQALGMNFQVELQLERGQKQVIRNR